MNWKDAECGACEYAVEVQQKSVVVQANKQKVFECRFSPPETLLLPINTPQGHGLQANPSYVKIGEHHPACSHYTEVQKPNGTMQRIPLDKLKNFSLPSDDADKENQES